MDPKNKENLSKLLQDVNDLLGKNKIVEDLVDKQEMPKQKLIKNLVQKQNLSALGKLLNSLHSADIAFILESLPLDDRLIVWDLVRADRDGEILLEVSDSVRQTLIADMDSTELLAAAEQLDTDEIADIASDLPEDVLQDLLQSLDSNNRERLESALSYPEDHVGALMDFDIVTIRDDISLEVALRYLRKIKKLPELTDKLFVINRSQKILGVLSLKKIVVNEPELIVRDVMAEDTVLFKDSDDAAEAAKAFERYDLVTAPVVNDQNKLVGRITVDAVMDYIREETDNSALSMVGLREGEDIFSSTWKSVRNRWAWLAINLITALIASRVIGVFEGSIEKVVALAALMPIVAGVGGNSGNQTTTMIVRAIALGQVSGTHLRQLLFKEISVAILNGILWGGVLGLIAYYLYENSSLALVMTTAMTLNLILAAIMGVMIPFALSKSGRDPAVGSSVLITAMTDSGGFFIFLGLATLILI